MIDVLSTDFFTRDFFTLFGVSVAFDLDTKVLEERYLALQKQAHPDQFAHADDRQKRLSLQASTHINHAYQTLKSPLNRARYLLQCHGVDTLEDSNTRMPMDFLMQQMTWREALDDAKQSKSPHDLPPLMASIQQERQQLMSALRHAFDTENHEAAALEVRKLRFLEKLDEEVNQVLDDLE